MANFGASKMTSLDSTQNLSNKKILEFPHYESYLGCPGLQLKQLLVYNCHIVCFYFPEYTSRDAHIGAHSRRSDLEILGYNLVHWMSGYLPWMDNLTNVDYVHAQKKGYMNDINAFMKICFKSEDYPGQLTTVQNFMKFPATQILREINFGKF